MSKSFALLPAARLTSFLRFAVVAIASCLWMIPSYGVHVLLVIQGSSPSGDESAAVSGLQGWGYTVSTIQDSASQASFDTALAGVDVVYIPYTIQQWELSYKLRTTSVGVVSEHIYMEAEIGFASDDGYTQSWHTIENVDNSHDVTQDMASGDNVVLNSSHNLTVNSTTFAPGLQVLGTMNYGGLSVGVLETGATLANSNNGNSTASGRRVRLPWGSGSWYQMNAAGQQLSRNALDWAAGGSSNTGHWTFDEGSGTTVADSENDNDASFDTGSPTWITGKRQGAIQFNGSNDIQTDGNFDPPGTGSVSFWYRFNAVPTGNERLLGLGGDWEVRADNTGTLYADLGGDGVGSGFQTPTGSANAGEWHHFAAIYNDVDDTFELYLDAELVASGSMSITDQAAAILSLGARTGSSERFNGALDDVRIFDYELSFAEVVELYGLVGHWTFDEGAGTTIADSSPNSNDASFNTGSPTWVSGIRGGALQFDGSSDAVTGSNFKIPDQGTIAFWFKQDGVLATRERILGALTDFELWQDPDGRIRFDLLGDGDDGGFATTVALTEANLWHHIVGTYDLADESYAIYIDGKLHKSDISATSMNSQSDALLTIGTRTGSTQRFSGSIDDLRIYSYVISDEDIAEISGYIGHWKLDETSGTVATDSSLAGNHGTYVGSPTLGYAAPRSYGAEFTNTTQQIAVPASTTLNNLADDGGSLTIAMWVKPSAPDGNDRPLIHKGSTTQERAPALALIGASNHVQYGINATGDWSAGSTSTNSLATDQWSHLILVKNGRDYSLYIDGQFDSSFTASNDSYGNTGTLYVGANPYQAGDPCVVDDVRLYNYAITQQQITEIYGLVAHWKLDETSGTTAYDSSGLDHHATLTGTETWTGGTIDGAHEFDYTDGEDYFTAPTTTILNDIQDNDYSVAAFFKPLSLPPGTGNAYDSAYGILRKNGYHTGISLAHDELFYNEHWIASGPTWSGVGTWSQTYSAGSFYHVAGVVNRTAGTSKIYVNGQLIETGTFTPGAASWDFGSNPWRIGVSYPGLVDWGHPAHGVIDDARLYNRVLTDDEVLKLYQSGQPQGVRIIRWIEVR